MLQRAVYYMMCLGLCTCRQVEEPPECAAMELLCWDVLDVCMRVSRIADVLNWSRGRGIPLEVAIM